ncbi:hypothetical protein GCM10028796_13610 [Ramlibacter monticola]|uniref:Uncharacterized protein n=1 Tax=Ramlibacter monticola TaxID=1926872 RepID=A0A937CSL8_9BURK|nr:hypothetical protein [Ramlibacter monticola]MBL0390197.1 hypothetical protein [Ramlibacter monticola]
MRQKEPSWSCVKAKLASLDRPGLISLIQALYSASKDNQAFLHARCGVGDDVLKPYKATINRWLSPDVFKNQDVSVAKAKQAISAYKKAIGASHGLAELMVFFCERAAVFSDEVGLQDEAYFDALLRMFAQALRAIATLSQEQRCALWNRLDAVRQVSQNFGYGVAEEMDVLLAEQGLDS